MITKLGNKLIDLDFNDSAIATGAVQTEDSENKMLPNKKILMETLGNLPKHLWHPIVGGALGYGTTKLLGSHRAPLALTLGVGGYLGGWTAAQSAISDTVSKRGVHPHKNPLKALLGYKSIEQDVVHKYAPWVGNKEDKK